MYCCVAGASLHVIRFRREGAHGPFEPSKTNRTCGCVGSLPPWGEPRFSRWVCGFCFARIDRGSRRSSCSRKVSASSCASSHGGGDRAPPSQCSSQLTHSVRSAFSSVSAAQRQQKLLSPYSLVNVFNCCRSSAPGGLRTWGLRPGSLLPGCKGPPANLPLAEVAASVKSGPGTWNRKPLKKETRRRSCSVGATQAGTGTASVCRALVDVALASRTALPYMLVGAFGVSLVVLSGWLDRSRVASLLVDRSMCRAYSGRARKTCQRAPTSHFASSRLVPNRCMPDAFPFPCASSEFAYARLASPVADLDPIAGVCPVGEGGAGAGFRRSAP